MTDRGAITEAIVDTAVDTVLREVWAVTDGDAPVPAEAIERIATSYGIELRTPGGHP